MTAPFPKAVVERFDATKTVEIETRSAKGTKHAVPIWIVVVDGVPYVRSVRGPAGRCAARRSGGRGVERGDRRLGSRRSGERGV